MTNSDVTDRHELKFSTSFHGTIGSVLIHTRVMRNAATISAFDKIDDARLNLLAPADNVTLSAVP